MKEKSPISGRIQMLINEFCNGKNSLFANRLGVNESNIRSYLSGTLPKFDILSVIAEKFAINCEWLLTGKGEMIKTVPEPSLKDVQTTIAIGRHSNRNEGIPLIPIDAMAGALSENSQTIMEYDCEHYVIPMFKGAEFLIPVKGDSMQPKYYSGDIVACKRLSLDTFFQWNRTYVIDSEQGVLIKRIKQGKDNDHIILVSDNPEYDPFPLEKSRIYSLALVIGVVRAE
ncbi:S24 family peptidase [Bacteroides fragilis]|jgi:phage repressor protein C with HTH and peptisase S24 domain|uniref:S24 family peptidase n=1 Tax=Bacteroides fragilis TaxID=817 RepID=UPI0015EF9595|nr:S24 family peptidase [Bacteroides fragilis]MBA4500499.1 peptidase S24 [Bacteroides fragilis]DAQ79913.1 MAG TPA: Repressor protein CI [Caudoviricetes sp.]